ANADTYTNTKNANDPDQTDEEALIRYSQQSDFRRDIIKGSMSAQRRKTITWELVQANEHAIEDGVDVLLLSLGGDASFLTNGYWKFAEDPCRRCHRCHQLVPLTMDNVKE
ncbi:hypothetical protein Goarm_014663, partial [Gossypium armourianum]|nr:hypothetical protein [Gossypium armourianum]